MYLAIFDIDGTLITTGGAGMRAFSQALQNTLGITVDGMQINPDGKTDPLILKELLASVRRSDCWSPKNQDKLFASYLQCLQEEMLEAKKHDWIRTLPGVIDLLEILSQQTDFCLGLVTGNLEAGARIKLEAAGLSKYFRFGGYGSDSEDRTTIGRIGIQRGIRAIAPEAVSDSFIIGDTPRDIVHGRAAGACVIAVASAGYSLEALEPHNPDLLVPDLTDAAGILSFMRMRSQKAFLECRTFCQT